MTTILSPYIRTMQFWTIISFLNIILLTVTVIKAGDPIVSCDFESGSMCGWTAASNPESLWLGIETVKPKYPYQGHSPNPKESGHMLSLHLGQGYSKDEGWSFASLYSDVIDARTPKCLSFWYISRQLSWGNQDRYFQIFVKPIDSSYVIPQGAMTIPYEHDPKLPWNNLQKTIEAIGGPGYKIEVRQYWYDETGGISWRNVTLFDDLVISDGPCGKDTVDPVCSENGVVTCTNKRCISSFHRCNGIWNECGPSDSADEPDCKEPDDYSWVSVFPLGFVFLIFILFIYRFYLRPRKREEEYPYVACQGFKVLKARVNGNRPKRKFRYPVKKSESTEKIIQKPAEV
ncbi:uncharacterized protein LOC141907362 [Tubulanus polymorphus]|uniref:uncharacterized protein LOC141907362 n=1 Tax=Tubulanus polymorphus TaxID=672921 RepID=UPI003DA32D4A